MPNVQGRYGEALANVALDEGHVNEYRNELEELVNALEENPELKNFMMNPVVTHDVKKETISEILAGTVHEGVLNLLFLLIDNGRLRELRGVLREYNAVVDNRSGTLDMKIVSAFPLDETQVNTLKEKYKVLYNANDVKATVKIDESIIGGLKVMIGDTLIDASIKGRIEALKKSMQR